jgi:hypothetical protein
MENRGRENEKSIPIISANIRAAAKIKPAWPKFQDKRNDCGKSIKQAINGAITIRHRARRKIRSD